MSKSSESVIASSLSNKSFTLNLNKKNKVQTLKIIRKRRGLTLEDVGRLSGLSPSYVSRLESEKRRLNSDVLIKLAKVLGCEVADLLKTEVNDIKMKDVIYLPQKDLAVYSVVSGESVVGVEKKYPIGFFEEPMKKVFRIPELIGVATSFAIYVVDDSNFPKYSKGDLLFIHTEKTPIRNKPALIIMKDKSVIVGCYSDESAEIIKYYHYSNFEKIQSVKKSEISAFYPIICSLEKYIETEKED